MPPKRGISNVVKPPKPSTAELLIARKQLDENNRVHPDSRQPLPHDWQVPEIDVNDTAMLRKGVSRLFAVACCKAVSKNYSSSLSIVFSSVLHYHLVASTTFPNRLQEHAQEPRQQNWLC